MLDSPFASAQEWNGKIYTGAWVEPGLGTADVLEKATGKVLAQTGIASAEDVARAAASAHHAQAQWAKVPGPIRGDILRRFSELLAEHAAPVVDQMIRETGTIRAKAEWEVRMTVREILEAAALGSAPTGIQAASAEVGRLSVARRVPVGVVGIITPWNSPLLLAARAVGPALAMGNAVLLKPDVQSPVAGGVLYARLFQEAGLPAGLLHVLPGAIETGQALVKDPAVDMVSFTGSTRAGREVGAVAGSLLKRVSLELGGNNPYVVLDDADIERAVSAGAFGSYFHQGQICLTAGRHLVHERIAETYTDALVRHVEKLTVGDPYTSDVQLGPMVNERQAERAEKILTDSLAKGAKLLAGGSRDGLFFEPTVLGAVRPGMAAFDEEIFGPIAPITTFSTDEEAIALANQTGYGLVAAVVGKDLARAQRVADGIHAGIVHINDQTLIHEVYGPIGGTGDSGNGFNHSTLTNADQFSEWQWVTTRTEVPEYPF
ncbi:benzaldehyde dehydrogenase [Catenulispora sp. NF23]|uniref:Benzaldehyde dehydrogenase n=1 Tax=Catenulispora pinistramenti TaxID=2705254 RepID=A0ABS5KQI4_9ACTN|nr:benzaldehyde dehydrogenase [Catenulispora pinistramenti]MBS2531741.1 benzaldehyde dehydrogenase [Catenulispora pinistramenti]MBS2548306.1 benzaldehyde dehydrogenase [Catenulispora pinistramenti]